MKQDYDNPGISALIVWGVEVPNLIMNEMKNQSTQMVSKVEFYTNYKS